MLCRMHECRALQGSSNAAGGGTEGTAERREAQERPLFALRVDNFSGREWALLGSARRARTMDGPSQKGYGWTFSTTCWDQPPPASLRANTSLSAFRISLTVRGVDTVVRVSQRWQVSLNTSGCFSERRSNKVACSF